ncbi:hypothetical protein H6P81_007463 [Aristolochia fimbriata]|uniref:SWIM-type domain-containing protein n=1 Tax=Aristolochia fimbriata TaxID=158543 RepID=A0AAV7F0X7_ARIFI|nr:hypothetical protein H6P81_007463 [Aristolochia fimbriata]
MRLVLVNCSKRLLGTASASSHLSLNSLNSLTSLQKEFSFPTSEMARWDEILTLPVQNPPTLEFSAGDLVWSKVDGWRDSVDRVALIPFTRVDDFVRGEQSNKECPTRFHVEARRRRSAETAYKPKVDGILEYILYWCSFGPDDHRKGGVIRPSRVYNAKRKTAAGRPNTKRGCVCHFIVKRLIAQPSVALVIYNKDKHVDKQGKPCHGPMDEKAIGTRAMYAPYISDELRLRVQSLLYVGVPVETIMQRHTESVEKQGGPTNRDDLLTHRYVRRLERRIRRSSYESDPDDAVSLSMWVEDHRSSVFFYEEFSDSEPFVVGIQTEWQLQQMIRYANRSIIASDSRFGTNKLKNSVHSLIVFNSDNKAIPVAWIITPRAVNSEVHKWIRALYGRVHSKDPTWKLAGFIVDDPSADVLAIRDVLQCSVMISFWRVRHAWHKNLMKLSTESEMCVEMSRHLGQAINSICRENGDAELFENFMEDFVDCTDFMDYFQATWLSRLGSWIKALKNLPLASQETSAALEFYHHQLNRRLLNEKDSNVYQRADWLVDKLATKVHSYYWLDEYSRKDDFARYQKDEWKSGLTFWHRASQIPDSNVIVEQSYAKVSSRHNAEKIHIVRNPGSEFAICDCDWSRMGNLCKHVIKVSQFLRSKGLALPSMSLFQYNHMLFNMLQSAVHDSLIRDHAVSLAICAQVQLAAILNPTHSETSKVASKAGSASVHQPSANVWGACSNGISDEVEGGLTTMRQSGTENGYCVGNGFPNRDAVSRAADETVNGTHIEEDSTSSDMMLTVEIVRDDGALVGNTMEKGVECYRGISATCGFDKLDEIELLANENNINDYCRDETLCSSLVAEVVAGTQLASLTSGEKQTVYCRNTTNGDAGSGAAIPVEGMDVDSESTGTMSFASASAEQPTINVNESVSGIVEIGCQDLKMEDWNKTENETSNNIVGDEVHDQDVNGRLDLDALCE